MRLAKAGPRRRSFFGDHTMVPLFLVIAFACVAVSFLLWLRVETLRTYFVQSYLAGLRFWAKWLPILSTIFFIFIAFANLSHLLAPHYPLLSTKAILKRHELFLLGIIAPLFLTQFGALVGCCVSLFISVKIMNLPGDALKNLFGVSSMLACSGFVSFLGDKVFENAPAVSVVFGRKIRRSAKWLVSILAIVLTFWSLFNLDKMLDWYRTTLFLGAALPPLAVSLLLLALITGWLSVFLTAENNFIYAVLCLPTIVIFAYFSADHTPFTILPAVTCLSLLVAETEPKMRSNVVHT